MSQDHKKYTPKGTNYLGLAFQVAVFVFLATYGGMLLDKKLEEKELMENYHIFVILFSLLSITFSMYYIIRKTKCKKKKND
jgi:membrane protein DedA with SNARE-associated domain